VGFSSDSAAPGGDVLLYRYVVREIGQTSTSTVDACRVGSVACKQLNCICSHRFAIAYYVLVHFLAHWHSLAKRHSQLTLAAQMQARIAYNWRIFQDFCMWL